MCSEVTPRVSVCVPTYNGLSRLRRTVPGLLADLGTLDEVIYSVDGSTDGTVAFLSGMAATDARLRIIENARNDGRTAALNAACRAARGRIVLRVDDDILVSPGSLDAHVAAHEGTADRVGVVQPIVDVIEESQKHTMWRAFVERNAVTDRSAYDTDDLPACVWGAVCSVERGVGEGLGWYDERFRAYGWEDVEFGYRAKADGVRLIMSGDPVQHLASAGTFEGRLHRAVESGARMCLFAQIHGPEAVLTALGRDARESRRPKRELTETERRARREGARRDLLSAIAMSGERLLAVTGWRRGYDWWVARWLTWASANGWTDAGTAAGLPPIEIPTAWPRGADPLPRERWRQLVGALASASVAYRLSGVAILRSAMLRELEHESATPLQVWRAALGAVRRFWIAASGSGHATVTVRSGAPVVFFDGATPSSVDGLIRVTEALERDGQAVALIGSAPFVCRFVKERHGRECAVIDDVCPTVEGRLAEALRSWRTGSNVAQHLSAEGARLSRAERVQLTAEAALATVLYDRLRRATWLDAASFVLTATEYFAPSVALQHSASERGVRTFTLQHGAVNCMYAPFRADEYLVWCEAAVEALLRLQPEASDRLKVVGSTLAYGVAPGREERRAELRRRLRVSDDAAVVCVFSQTHGHEFSAATHFALAAQLHLLMEAIPGLHVVVKRHPSEPRSAYESLVERNPRCHLAPDGFEAWHVAAASDLAIALGSTALIDATGAGCATVEVRSPEALMEQALSSEQVPVGSVGKRLAELFSDRRGLDALAQRQYAERGALLGPQGFEERVLERLLWSSVVAADV